MAKKRSLYPDYMDKVFMAGFIVFEAALAAALLYPAPIGQKIDFVAQYQPRPEWYFLWIYRLLRYFPGGLAVIGAVVIPVGFGLLIFFIPYIGRGGNGHVKASIIGAGILAAVIALTLVAVFTV